MFIYQITLPQDQDLDAFVTFMREVYFPGFYKGSTRVGQVTDLLLLQKREHTETAGREFFLQIGWDGYFIGSGIHFDNEDVKTRFEAFNPEFTLVGFYDKAAVWDKTAPTDQAG